MSLEASKAHLAFTLRFHTFEKENIYMAYKINLGDITYSFRDLKDLMAKATPIRSGDELAGIAATSMEEHVAAQMRLAEVPLQQFLEEPLIDYDKDEITRLIIDTHDKEAFSPISHLTVGDFRNWLLNETCTSDVLSKIAPGITPEMAAAVSKIMRNQDLILAASKCRVITKFRNTLGLPGRMAVRLQPNHPVDDLKGIAASIIDGLMYGSGDAVIGINPASDSLPVLTQLNYMLDDIINTYNIPTQSCILTHVTTCMEMIEHGAPVDLLFQSIAGTEAANAGFGITLKMLDEGYDAVMSLHRGTVGNDCMYFETGQGSALSSDANFGVDEQTCEARCYAVARRYHPLLVNTVVGFIGPEYLYDGKQITRAGLEDHFCGKLMGVPMGCDICYTNHAEADQNDMDNLLTLLAAAGVNYIMGIPGADDIMLNYQSTSYHDALYIRKLLGKRHAPEFEEWLQKMHVIDGNGDILPILTNNKLLGIEEMEAVHG